MAGNEQHTDNGRKYRHKCKYDVRNDERQHASKFVLLLITVSSGIDRSIGRIGKKPNLSKSLDFSLFLFLINSSRVVVATFCWSMATSCAVTLPPKNYRNRSNRDKDNCWPFFSESCECSSRNGAAQSGQCSRPLDGSGSALFDRPQYFWEYCATAESDIQGREAGARPRADSFHLPQLSHWFVLLSRVLP